MLNSTYGRRGTAFLSSSLPAPSGSPLTQKQQGRSHRLALTRSTLVCGLLPPRTHNTHTARLTKVQMFCPPYDFQGDLLSSLWCDCVAPITFCRFHQVAVQFFF